MTEPEPPPKDVTVAASIDWRLRGANWVDSAFRWGCVLAAALFSLAGIGTVLTLGIKGFTGGGFEVIASAGGMALVPASLAAGLFARWGLGKGGWWGNAVARLSREFPSTTGTIYGRFPLLSGIRLRHSRRVLFLFAPHRFVLVSRGWSPPVMTGILCYTAFVIACSMRALPQHPQAGLGILTVLLPAALLFAILAARRMELYEVSYDDVREVVIGEKRIRFDLRGGVLEPGFEFRPYPTERADFWGHAATRWPNVFAADGAGAGTAAGDAASAEAADLLSRVQQEYEE